MKKILTSLAISLMVVGVAQAQSSHDVPVNGAGKVYFKIKPAYPLPLERMVFMSNVYNLEGLEVGSTIGELDENATRLMREDPENFHKSMPQPPESYQPKPKEMERLARSMKKFDMTMTPRDQVPHYNSIPSPGIIYFAPDGKAYTFDFPPFTANKQEAEFMSVYNKYKNTSKRNDMFKSKKWGQ